MTSISSQVSNNDCKRSILVLACEFCQMVSVLMQKKHQIKTFSSMIGDLTQVAVNVYVKH